MQLWEGGTKGATAVTSNSWEKSLAESNILQYALLQYILHYEGSETMNWHPMQCVNEWAFRTLPDCQSEREQPRACRLCCLCACRAVGQKWANSDIPSLPKQTRYRQNGHLKQRERIWNVHCIEKGNHKPLTFPTHLSINRFSNKPVMVPSIHWCALQLYIEEIIAACNKCIDQLIKGLSISTRGTSKHVQPTITFAHTVSGMVTEEVNWWCTLVQDQSMYIENRENNQHVSLLIQ